MGINDGSVAFPLEFRSVSIPKHVGVQNPRPRFRFLCSIAIRCRAFPLCSPRAWPACTELGAGESFAESDMAALIQITIGLGFARPSDGGRLVTVRHS
jgi:hypothetical protein